MYRDQHNTFEQTEQNNIYSQMFMQLPEAQFSILPDLRIDDVNFEGEKITGAKRADMINKPVLHFFPANQIALERGIHHVMSHKTSHTLQAESSSGVENSPYELLLYPLLDQAGVVKRIILQVRLQEDAMLYRRMVEESLVGVYIGYVETKGFVYVNPRLAEIFGYTQEEMREKTAVEWVIPEERTVVREHQVRRIQGDTSSIRHEFHGMRKDGTVINVEVIQKTTTYKGKPAVVGMLMDVTNRKQAEEMIRKSEMLSIVGQLAAGVAHEIRNPLTSLIGFTQLLRPHLSESEEYFDIMFSELKRIEYIISEFLVLAKPHTTVFQKKNIVPLLQQIIVLAETHAAINNVQIESLIESNLPLINCEENQLKQVFLNLLKNAIEAMPNGGTIAVMVKRLSDNKLLIQIKDQGCGIPEKQLARLGEPFFTTKENGTGLGLMVSYKIIENHGGSISVKSEPNQGTVFNILLPIDSANVCLDKNEEP